MKPIYEYSLREIADIKLREELDEHQAVLSSMRFNRSLGFFAGRTTSFGPIFFGMIGHALNAPAEQTIGATVLGSAMMIATETIKHGTAPGFAARLDAQIQEIGKVSSHIVQLETTA